MLNAIETLDVSLTKSNSSLAMALQELLRACLQNKAGAHLASRSFRVVQEKIMDKQVAAAGVVLGIVAGCCHTPPPPPPPPPAQVCLGYTKKVQEACGCPERYIKLNSLLQGVNEKLRTAITECASGEGAASLASVEFGSVKFRGCVEKKEEYDPALTKQLTSIVDSLSKESIDENQAQIWTQCFATQMLGAGPSPFSGSFGGTLELQSKYAHVRTRAKLVVGKNGHCSMNAELLESEEPEQKGVWRAPTAGDSTVAHLSCTIDESEILLEGADDSGSRIRCKGVVSIEAEQLTSNLGCIDPNGASGMGTLTLKRQ